jgi:hypothetical protein
MAEETNETETMAKIKERKQGGVLRVAFGGRK